jgi:hypothetical protein
MPEYKCPQLDNRHFGDKIALREAILREAGFGELHVLDLFAGAGHVWREMQKRHNVATYLPVDSKPRMPGTLKLEVNARTVQAFTPDNFNVIDIDAYGSPWELLPHLMSGTKALAIFLTFGNVDPHRLSKFLATAVGMPLPWRDQFFNAQLCFFCGEQFLGQQFGARFRAVRRLRYPHAFAGERVRYYGMLLGAA